MRKKMQYKSLDHALKYFRHQVSCCIIWAQENLPPFETPEQVFNYLKSVTTYKHDPKGVELFQTIKTLLTDNFHGVDGAGDCDCFTIAVLTVLIANLMTDCGIVLAGRSPLYPVHIWARCTFKGRTYDLDLTCKRFNQTRYYPITQYIPYQLNEKEKAMLLQLAEGGDGSQRPKYIYLASKGINVREDYFDHLNSGKFQTMCLSEGLNIETIEELSAGRAQRRAEKKMANAQVKAFKQQNKPKNIRRAQAQTARQERKSTRLDKKEFMTGAERAQTVGNIVKGATAITGAIVSKGAATTMPDFDNVPNYNAVPQEYFNTASIPDYQSTQIQPYQDAELVYTEEVPNEDMGESVTWMLIKANKKPLLIGLGLLTLAGVGAYALKRSKH